ncbi:MAG: SpoIID/LytB domain-containing protein [Deltaproteobacteria bacterium]|nr:SpoIID/LytB domain-containing protein [Deltaproteobacteria bacterium]
MGLCRSHTGWLLFGLVLFLQPASALSGQGYSVRLAVANSVKSVQVEGQRLTILDGDVRDVLVKESKKAIKLTADPAGIVLSGYSHRPRSVILWAKSGLKVNGRLLVGEVEVFMKKSGLLVINRLDLERYLTGLLGAEMSASWPIEALKAQAVASRTFAIRRCLDRENHDFDLSTSTLDQVYKGIAREAHSTKKAVSATRGEVLTYGGMPAEALFHSCCGGRTRSAQEVFGNQVAYLSGAKDPYCSGCKSSDWKVRVTLSELKKKLKRRKGWSGPIVRVVKTTSPKGFRATRIIGKSAELVLSNHELRVVLGLDVLLSSEFVFEVEGTNLLFTGRGRGHGVGMCQWGARGMAEKGKDYKAILNKYYTRADLRKLY